MTASAQEPLKIGVILPYSGPFADAANQLEAGINLYMQQNGDEVAGRKIEIIRKDTGGPAPDVASGWHRNWWCATTSTSWRASRSRPRRSAPPRSPTRPRS
jgi:hypothetical protein